jgi:agmatinase
MCAVDHNADKRHRRSAPADGVYRRAVGVPPIDRSTLSPELLWGAPRTFFGVPSVRDVEQLDAQVAFVGVPFDAGTPQPGNRTGQAAGPVAARLQSFEQFEYCDPPRVGASGWYDIERDRDYLVGVTMADLGDVAIQGADVERNFARITEVARRIVERGALPVAVGGDHSISYPLGRGMAAHGPVDVVSLDAHADFLDELDGSRCTGASEMRRLSELPFVRSVSMLGLRNVARTEVDAMREHDVRWATSLDVQRAPADAARQVVPRSNSLYVSIDLDVLDSAIVPATTLPEPGGPSYRQIREVLAAIAAQGTVIGFDIVELNPPHDTGVTARIATWLMTHFLAEIFQDRQPAMARPT